jgi:hypothetical protein
VCISTTRVYAFTDGIFAYLSMYHSSPRPYAFLVTGIGKKRRNNELKHGYLGIQRHAVNADIGRWFNCDGMLYYQTLSAFANR